MLHYYYKPHNRRVFVSSCLDQPPPDVYARTADRIRDAPEERKVCTKGARGEACGEALDAGQTRKQEPHPTLGARTLRLCRYGWM